MNTIPLKDSLGPALQVSKWLSCPALIDADEMQNLLHFLQPFWIVQISGVIQDGQETISLEEFLDFYSSYIHCLQTNHQIDTAKKRRYFSSIWTQQLDALYKVKIKDSAYLIRTDLPVIQLQAHHLTYSAADSAFRSMVFGQEGIDWGIYFSFPSLFQNSQFEVIKIKDKHAFPHADFFKKLQGWMRSHTQVTSFKVNGKTINVPIRLGKNCFKWINQHPQLIKKNIEVVR